MATVKIGSARIDENGKISGGKAGDQTGKEVSTQDWYKHSKGWVLLRLKDFAKALLVAAAMKALCANPDVGYDQGQRDTLHKLLESLGFDVSKLDEKVETDCSALVRVCLAVAGLIVGNFTTTNEVSVLMATGLFDKFTASQYTTSPDLLQPGDILVTKTKGHTVVVLTKGDKAVLPTASQPPVPVILEKGVRVIGGEVHIRTGPGTGYSSVGTVKKGAVMEPVATDGWRPVLINGNIRWISARPDLTEVVG